MPLSKHSLKARRISTFSQSRSSFGKKNKIKKKILLYERFKKELGWIISRAPSSKKNKVSEASKNVSGDKRRAKYPVKTFTPLSDNESFEEIKKKTLVLGRIKCISEFELIIWLPRRFKGSVPVTKISDEYSSLLQEFLSGEKLEIIDLQHLFHEKEFVLAKVEEYTLKEGQIVPSITLSLKPCDVNSSYTCTDLREDLILSASVQSVEELGYIMNCGMNGVQSFLKRKNVKNNANLVVGQVVVCSISECSVFEEGGSKMARVQLKTLDFSTHGNLFEMSIKQDHPDTIRQVPKRIEFFMLVNGLICQRHMDKNFNKTPNIGQLYSVKIIRIDAGGLCVEDIDSGIIGEIPTEQLTDWLKLCKLVKDSYKTNLVLNAYCLCRSYPTLFTISPTFKYYFENLKKKRSILQKDDIVPSRVVEINSELISVRVPIPGTEKGELFLVECDESRDWSKDINELNLTLEVQIRESAKHISDLSLSQGKCSLTHEVDGCCVESGVLLLEDFVMKCERIHSYMNNENRPLGYLSICSEVEGTITNITKSGATLQLSSGGKGLVTPFHYEGMVLKKHDKVQGRVLFVDFPKKLADVSLKADVCKLLSLCPRNLEVYEIISCQILISKSEFSLGAFSSNDYCHLVYIPSRWHINNVNPSPCFKVGALEQVITVPNKTGVTIAIPITIAEKDHKLAEILRTKEPHKFTINNSLQNNTSNKKVVKCTQKNDVKGKEIVKDNKCVEEKNVKNKGESNKISNDVDVSKETFLSTENTIKSKRTKGNEDEENTNIELMDSSNVTVDNANLNSTLISNSLQDSIVNKRVVKSGQKNAVKGNTCVKKKIVKNKGEKNKISNSADDSKETSLLLKKTMKPKRKKENDDEDNTSIEVIQCSNVSTTITDKNPAVNNISLQNKTTKEGPAKNTQKSNLKGKGIVKDINCVKKKIGKKIKSKQNSCNEDYTQETCLSLEKAMKSKRIKGNEDEENANIELMESSNVTVDNENLNSTLISNSLQDSIVNKRVVKSGQKNAVKDKDIVKGNNCVKRKIVKNKGEKNKISNSADDSKETSLSLEKTMKAERKKENDDEENTRIEIMKSCNVNANNEMKPAVKCVKRRNQPENVIFSELGVTDSEKLLAVNKKKKKSIKEDTISNELPKVSQNCLKVEAGFFWDASFDQLPAVLTQKEEDTSEEEEIQEENEKKKKKKLTRIEVRELARREEESIRKTEERLMNAEKNPQSADDFDRLVMTSPNNSQNWVKYMAYHLQATEIVKARAVAQRALKTISFREEQEKLNVWLALLNLENLFGTHESLQQTLEEAVKFNDPYKVHMQVLTMFSSTKKLEELDSLVQLVIKKYKQDKNTWIQAGTAYLKCGELEKSRRLMQKALNVLEKKYHVELLSRFAFLENEMGDAERAETIMENILSSYPKRIDVWMVYIDMLVKSKKVDLARQVLDRAVIQKLPPTKMKSLYKKYLKFEQDHGTPQGVQKVQEMAKSYVEASSSHVLT